MRLAVVALAVLPLSVGAAQLIVERPLGPVVAETAPGLIPYDSRAFRVLSSGAIVVAGRSVRLIDATLRTATIVMDSTREQPPSMPIGIVLPEAHMATPARRYGIAPFAGDSTIVVASDGVSLTLIDANGVMGREFSMPYGEFRETLLSAGSMSALDSHGRLVVQRLAVGSRRGDSVPLLRVQFAPRVVDTVAKLLPRDAWGALAGNALWISRATHRGGFASTDRLGQVWVARNLEEEDRRVNGDLYDVFDAIGNLVDRVRVPPGATIIGFTGSAVCLRTSTAIQLRIGSLSEKKGRASLGPFGLHRNCAGLTSARTSPFPEPGSSCCGARRSRCTCPASPAPTSPRS